MATFFPLRRLLLPIAFLLLGPTPLHVQAGCNRASMEEMQRQWTNVITVKEFDEVDYVCMFAALFGAEVNACHWIVRSVIDTIGPADTDDATLQEKISTLQAFRLGTHDVIVDILTYTQCTAKQCCFGFGCDFCHYTHPTPNRFAIVVGFRHPNDRKVKLVNQWSGKCLDASRSSHNRGNIYAHPCLDVFNQKFWLMGETGQIKTVDTLSCMDASVDGTNRIYEHACHDGGNQKWEFWPDGTLRTVHNPALCADENTSNSDVFQYPCHTGTNQKWTIQDA